MGLSLGASSALQAADIEITGVLKREVWPGATRAQVLDGSAGQPSTVGVVTRFEAPAGVGDNYSSRISGFFTPDRTGDYIFFLAADDDTDLYLSTDATPANKKLIAQEQSWSGNLNWQTAGAGDATFKNSYDFPNGEWPGGPNIVIPLTAGRKYYIEAVHHEGSGGDNLAATFVVDTFDYPPDGTATALTGNLISALLPSGTVTITQQPANVSTIAGVTATFSVETTHTGVVAPTYQWRRNGADIGGATSASYTTPVLALSDNNAKYTVRIAVPGAEVISSEATLNVTDDTLPPQVLSAGGLRTQGGGIEVGLIFDEVLNPASVTADKFTLSAGTVTAARYLPNSSGKASLRSGVVLTTTGLTAGQSYTVTVQGVSDAYGNAMASTATPFKVSSMSWAALGTQTAQFPAAAIAVGDDGFDVNGGGASFWTTNDDVTFVYEQVTGDFDKVLRVEYQDPSSQWARAGIHARETLDGTGETASRYQNSHANPSVMVSGQASNNSFETNRRLSTGSDATSSTGGGTPEYPNAWVRLRRQGDLMHMYRSNDGNTWIQLGTSDFNPADGSLPEGPLANSMYVGAVYGPENGNLTEANESLRGVFAVRFRDYGDFEPSKARGSQAYTIGINFTDASNQRGGLGPREIAGVNPIAQGNWNDLPTLAISEEAFALKAEVSGAAQNTTATVEWTSANTWASSGRGEENNMLTGSDRQLLVGYLDTGNATTTQVTVRSLPTQLTGGNGYDLVLYTLGGVAGRGGAFRVTDENGTELRPYVRGASPANPTSLTRVPVVGEEHGEGTYIVFEGLKAANVIVEATTEGGFGFSDTPRAPINAIQLVAPTGLLNVVQNPEISIVRAGAGATITYIGRLQRADTVNGPYTDVAGATSPYTVSAPGFFRATQ